MKFCCISDTHGKHRDLSIEPCDFIIHSGDIFRKSKIETIIDFVDWYANLIARYKILVGGNHDRFIAQKKEIFIELIKDKIIYLENSGIEIEGIKFWGSPSVNWCGPYQYFAYSNEQEAEAIFEKIPFDTDFLITHGPPYGILDREYDSNGHAFHHGSMFLLERVLKIKPKYHLFGHVHKSYGIIHRKHTVFINSCMVNNNEELVNQPIFFEYSNEFNQ
jgi:Icc-related predicted phosphoesterase